MIYRFCIIWEIIDEKRILVVIYKTDKKNDKTISGISHTIEFKKENL